MFSFKHVVQLSKRVNKHVRLFKHSFSTRPKTAPLGFTFSGNLGKGGVSVGQRGYLERQFKNEEVLTFGRLSGDFNPVHYEVVEESPFDQPIVHGMLYSTMFGTTFATMVPGVIYLSQDLKFTKPVFVDDVVRAEIHVNKVRNRIAYCTTNCVRVSDSVVVVEGKANVLLPPSGSKGKY